MPANQPSYMYARKESVLPHRDRIYFALDLPGADRWRGEPKLRLLLKVSR